MTLNYTPLLKVVLDHPYFGDDGCPVVDIIPTGTTERIMDHLMIRSIKRDLGIELFNGSRNEQATGLETIEENEVVCLSFILRSTDPTFLNYTHLDISEATLNQLIYLNNVDGNDLSFNSDNRYLLRSPASRFLFEASQEVTPESISLKDGYGNVIATLPQSEDDKLLTISEINERGTDKKSTVVNLDLQRYPCGFYQLMIDGTAKESFVTDNDGLRQGDLGLLSIYLEKGAGTREDITVNFTNRATYWRYFIIGDQATDQHLSVTDQDENEVSFTLADQDRQLPNGQTAKILVSANPITLQRRYPTHHKLKLVKSIDGREMKFTMNLPNADSQRINYEKITDTEENEKHLYFSDIYLYL